MVTLGRGLMSGARLLLLDDPFLGLSPIITKRFCDTFRTLRQGGMTLFIAGQHVRRILNVAVAEAATVPALPVTSPLLLILAGGVLALLLSSMSAFAADYFDQSFRTPDEVIHYLDMPVLAAFPKNGHPPMYALPSSDTGALHEAPFRNSERKRLFARRRKDED